MPPIPRWNRTVLATGVLCLCAHAAFAQATFTGLGSLSTDGSVYSMAYSVSGDGSVVVGDSWRFYGSDLFAFRWTQGTGMVGLSPTIPGIARAAAADGSIVVGAAVPSNRRAYQWLSDGSPAFLGFSYAFNITPDGTTVVGIRLLASGSTPTAVLWTAEDGVVDLLAGTSDRTYAYAISEDGSVVVGQHDDHAVRWVDNGHPEFLGLLPGAVYGRASDVSHDGTVVVGTSGYGGAGDSRFDEAFRWTSESGMVGLGHFEGGAPMSEANAVSADGSVVVGGALYPGTDRAAFIWDAANGMRVLQDVLVAQGADLTGWVLWEASGISDDGRTIVGTGMNPDLAIEAWVAALESPSAPAVPALPPLSIVLLATLLAAASFAWLRSQGVFR